VYFEACWHTRSEGLMQKRWFGVLAAAGMLLSADPAFADRRDFRFTNASGYPLKFVGVNPPGDGVWNENEIKGRLADGAGVDVTFRPSDKGCIWNIKVVWSDDNSSSVFNGLNFCNIRSMTLQYDAKTDQASYRIE
jgi:hypothetical protein